MRPKSMATVVVVFSGVEAMSSSASLACVISASVVSGSISETDPTNVVLPTPKPPATTILVDMGACERSSCQSFTPGAVPSAFLTSSTTGSEPAKSTQHPFQQRTVGPVAAVPGAVNAHPSLIGEVAQQNPYHAQGHL